MIKGCAKRVVVVRDIDSNFFEEAFFIVKQGYDKRKSSESDYINEAGRILKSDLPVYSDNIYPAGLTLSKIQSSKSYRRKNISRDLLMFIFGFGLSAIMCTLIYYSGIAV